MNSPHLGIGQTPLQVLNLVEAMWADGVEAEIFVLWRDARARTRIEELLRDLSVDGVRFLRVSGLAGKLLPLKMLWLGLLRRRSVRRVYFGTYTTWVSFLVNLLGADEHVLIDDGQKTINILTAPHLVGLDRKRGWPVSRDYVDSARLFTFYDELAKQVGRNASANRLTLTSERLRGAGNSATKALDPGGVFFIGTHIEDTYGCFEEHLARVLATAGGRPVTYALHPRDNEERMVKLGQALGFQVVRFERPLEIEFNQIWLTHRPEIWTFGTTATDTLIAMHEGLRVQIFRLDPEAFTRASTGRAFESIYAHYEGNANVELVEIPPAQKTTA